jgi:hypothetical protein
MSEEKKEKCSWCDGLGSISGINIVCGNCYAQDKDTTIATLTKSLEEARKWMRHNPACAVYATPIGLPCDCGLDAFLSTLEGEKKDHTPECAVLIAVSKPYRGDVPGCDCGLDSTKKDPSK